MKNMEGLQALASLVSSSNLDDLRIREFDSLPFRHRTVAQTVERSVEAREIGVRSSTVRQGPLVHFWSDLRFSIGEYVFSMRSHNQTHRGIRKDHPALACQVLVC